MHMGNQSGKQQNQSQQPQPMNMQGQYMQQAQTTNWMPQQMPMQQQQFIAPQQQMNANYMPQQNAGNWLHQNAMPQYQQQSHVYLGHAGSSYTPLDKAIIEWKNSEEVLGQTMNLEKIANPDGSENLTLQNTIEFGAQLERTPLVYSTTMETQGMMVSLSETKLGDKDMDTCKADVVCIIDISGSMAGAKLEYVKKTLTSLLSFLNGSRLGIVVFDDNAEVLMNLKIVNDHNLANIQKVIDSLQTRGSTNISGAVHCAQNLLGQRKTKNEVASLFLLSDGQHNQGPISNELMFSNDIKRSGTDYTLHTFGYGDDHDAKLMQSMSEHKHGNYYFVNDITIVDECFVDCLGMVTTALASKGTLTLKLQPTAFYPEIRIVRTYGPYWKKISDTQAVLSLNSIYAGFKKDFVVEVEFDPTKTAIQNQVVATIATLDLEFTELGSSAPVKLSRNVQVTILPQNHGQTITRNLEVQKNILRVKGGQTIKDASELNNQGKGKEAVLLLDAMHKDLEMAVALKDDPVISSLAQQMKEIKTMIENEMAGRQNACKSANYMMQQANMYSNQASQPMYAMGAMFQNSKQSSNVQNLRMTKK